MRFLLGVFLLAAPPGAIADPKAGENKAQLCLLCHRPGTQFGAGIPLLEGRPAQDLVAAVAEFKSGKRISPSMQPNVERLSARDIADIAAYFASKPPATGAAPEAARISTGQLDIGELKP